MKIEALIAPGKSASMSIRRLLDILSEESNSVHGAPAKITLDVQQLSEVLSKLDFDSTMGIGPGYRFAVSPDVQYVASLYVQSQASLLQMLKGHADYFKSLEKLDLSAFAARSISVGPSLLLTEHRSGFEWSKALFCRWVYRIAEACDGVLVCSDEGAAEPLGVFDSPSFLSWAITKKQYA